MWTQWLPPQYKNSSRFEYYKSKPNICLYINITWNSWIHFLFSNIFNLNNAIPTPRDPNPRQRLSLWDQSISFVRGEKSYLWFEYPQLEPASEFSLPRGEPVASEQPPCSAMKTLLGWGPAHFFIFLCVFWSASGFFVMVFPGSAPDQLALDWGATDILPL